MLFRSEVAGLFGYQTTPMDVKRAVMITAATWYKRARHGSENDVVGGLMALPREAKDLMGSRGAMMA